MAYIKYTTKELIEYIRKFKFTRKLKQWHIHHTWEPDYSDFNGKNHDALQTAMRNYHMNTRGWSDIAQHFTLFPDGVWLLGRDLNKNPASISGWNDGAISVEMVGNFDIGHDKMTEAQKEAIYEMTEFMVKEMKLEPHFHRDHPNAGKTCPGSGIDREKFFAEALNFTVNKEKEKIKKELEALMETMKKLGTVFVDLVLPNGQLYWANADIMNLYNNNIVSGINNMDGTKRFEPERPITRAETAVIVNRAFMKLMQRIDELSKKIDNLR